MAHQVVALQKARHLDFEFFKCVATSMNPIEFGGFNPKLCREQGQRVKPATKAMYMPLIDMNPAHPDSMLTAMTEAQRLMKECGQNITILTNDQQLYRLAVSVKLVYQERFSDFIPRLGGMHMFEFYWLCCRRPIDGRQCTRGYHEIEFRWCGTNAVGEEVPTEL